MRVPDATPVPLGSRLVEDPNGIWYRMEVTGVVDVTRGPLGRFVDLAEQITAEGLQVPPRLAAVLAELQQPEG